MGNQWWGISDVERIKLVIAIDVTQPSTVSRHWMEESAIDVTQPTVSRHWMEESSHGNEWMSLATNGEGKAKGQLANPGLHG